MFGRNGEAPVPIVAPQSPGDCFDAAVEAARIAITYRTPVMLLSDGYLANGSEPWQIPEVADLPAIDPAFATETNHDGRQGQAPSSGPTCATRRRWPGRGRCPARRASSTGSAAWRRATGHGNISYDPANHDFMVRTRAAKVDRIAERIPPTGGRRPRSGEAKVLVLGWGSTYGPIGAAVRAVRNAGYQVAQAHLRHLNPFPTDLGDVLQRYDAVMVPEMNLGQLAHAAAREVPRRRRRLQPGPRPAAARRPSSPTRSPT